MCVFPPIHAYGCTISLLYVSTWYTCLLVHLVLMMCVSFFVPGAESRALRKTPGRHPWRLRRNEVATGKLSRARRKGSRQQKGTPRLELVPRRERPRRLFPPEGQEEEEGEGEGEEEEAEEVEEEEEEEGQEEGRRNSSRRR